MNGAQKLGRDGGYLLSDVVGPTHRMWIEHPFIFAVISLIYVLAVYGLSLVLSIGRNFGPDEKYKGFLESWCWGCLLIWAVPLSVIGLGYFFRFCSEATASLDSIIVPKDSTTPSFTQYLLPELKKWSRGIVPIALLAAIALTVFADRDDILSPWAGVWGDAARQSQTDSIREDGAQPEDAATADQAPGKTQTARKSELDWSTMGFEVHGNGTWLKRLQYFLFNLGAYSMATFLGYCALLLFIGAGALVFWLTKCLSVLERHRRAELPGGRIPRRGGAVAEAFRIEWDWGGPNGRCGLHEFDKVYGWYVLLVGLALVAAAVVIYWNVTQYGEPDRGCWVLALGTLLLLPVAFVWVIFPYWWYFPESRPDDPDGRKKIQPTKWPFGSKVGCAAILFVWGLWLGIAIYIFPFLRIVLGLRTPS